MTLNAAQKSRLRKLVAAEVVRQVLAHHNFGGLAIFLFPENPDQFTPLPGRVVIFDIDRPDNIIATFSDRDDPDVVDVHIPDAFYFIKPMRMKDFYPEEHGLDSADPYISIPWPVAEIREASMAMAMMPPPPRKTIKPRMPEVKGGPDDVN